MNYKERGQMGFKSDREIAQENRMTPIVDIARNINIPEEAIEA